MTTTPRLIADVLHHAGEPVAKLLPTVRPTLLSHFERWLEARRELAETQGELAEAEERNAAARTALREVVRLLADDRPKRAQQVAEAALKDKRS